MILTIHSKEYIRFGGVLQRVTCSKSNGCLQTIESSAVKWISRRLKSKPMAMYGFGLPAWETCGLKKKISTYPEIDPVSSIKVTRCMVLMSLL